MLFSLFLGAEIVKISAGSENGTYIKIANDIADIVAPDARLRMKVLTSKGSKENIKRLEKKEVEFAIIQHDIIQILKSILEQNSLSNSTQRAKLKEKYKKYKILYKNINILLPLYTEKLHLIVKPDSEIRDFMDLEGKKISVGTKGSGTAATSILIYQKVFNKKLKASQIDRSTLSDALDKLDSGEIDAVFYVAGEPISSLKRRNKKYRLVPIPLYKFKALENFYYDSTIPAHTYRWQSRDIPTIGVVSFLVCNRQNSLIYKDMRRFGRAFAKNLRILREDGFASDKWQEVNETLPALPSTQKWKYCPEFKKGWDSYRRSIRKNRHKRGGSSLSDFYH